MTINVVRISYEINKNLWMPSLPPSQQQVDLKGNTIVCKLH
jgi:hypothetical protein